VVPAERIGDGLTEETMSGLNGVVDPDGRTPADQASLPFLRIHDFMWRRPG